jgi:hypothetical protein
LSRLGKRGVRVVTNVGRDAVDAAMSIKTSDMAADGEVVWSWRPDAGAKLAMMRKHHAGDGGKKARFTEESTK